MNEYTEQCAQDLLLKIVNHINEFKEKAIHAFSFGSARKARLFFFLLRDTVTL